MDEPININALIFFAVIMVSSIVYVIVLILCDGDIDNLDCIENQEIIDPNKKKKR